MQKWEYIVLNSMINYGFGIRGEISIIRQNGDKQTLSKEPDDHNIYLTLHLNKLGKDGWEVVSGLPVIDQQPNKMQTYILKRPAQDK